MTKRKTLKELTIKDNFMFGAVMCEEDNCKDLLELVLKFPIARVEVSKEKSLVYHPEYKGIRLDVYAKDENYSHYNIEMQAVSHVALGTAHGIIIARLTWIYWRPEKNMWNFRILM